MSNQDEVIEEFLEGQPRAQAWREMRETLEARLKDAVAARDGIDPEDPQLPGLERRVRDLRAQVAALGQEEAITQFVEESVRASLNRPRPFDESDDEEDG